MAFVRLDTSAGRTPGGSPPRPVSTGPVAVLGSRGFRPFFLLGGAFAALVVPYWVLAFTGATAPAGPLAGIAWHAHEMIHGFTVAIIAGFLLTAVTNWTGRETAVGGGLWALALLWLAGRAALLAVPGPIASVIDLLFLPALAVAIGRPILRAGNLRNAAFPLLLLALWTTNLAAHLDAHGVLPGAATAAHRVAVHLIAVIILVVTGRIIPGFTRNATGVATIRNVRALDWTATLATAALALLQLATAPALQAIVAGVAAVSVLGRAWFWGARHTLREPLLWVLHAGHAFVGIGLALEALEPLVGFARSISLHAITVGGIGALTIGMMARVALGHSGRPLRVRPVIGLAFGAVILAALARVLGPLFLPSSFITWMWTAAVLWAAAFAAYVVVYAPILARPRPDGRPG